MLILSDTDIERLFSFEEITKAVQTAVMTYENDKTMIPQRMHFSNGANTSLCMPSFGKEFFGTKLVSVFPGNAVKGLPVTNGAMLLNDAATGLPLALLNASKLTALRTGALGALGAKYLSPESETTFGVIGCGVQGMHLAAFICAIRKMTKVYYLCRSPERASIFLSFLQKYYPDKEVEACYSAEALLKKTNVIVAATPSAFPVMPDNPDLISGKHFVGVGSYKPSMQEFPDSVYRLAGKLVIDSEAARRETGDCLNPLAKGILHEGDIFTLGKMISGEQQLNVLGTTVFKSTGMALFDLFVAQAIYERARVVALGTNVAF